MQPPEWIDRNEYPFLLNYVDVGPGRMHYVDVGPRSAKTALLFLHGNPTWSFLYRNVIRQLDDRFRCVAPDWIGFGLSDKPKHWTYRPKDHAACLRQFINSVDLRSFRLVVHDWGGPIGLSIAIDDPARVQSIVAMNTWLWSPADSLRLQAFGRIGGSSPARFLIQRFNLLVRLMPLGFGKPSRLTPAAKAHYRRVQSGHRQACAQLPKEFKASAEWLDDLWSRRRSLEDIPKAFLWGDRDRALGRQPLDRWIDAFPEASVDILEDVGHFVPEEAPGAVVKTVERQLTR